MKKKLQKLSSILLCFVMLLSLLPTTALAVDEIKQVSLTLDVPVIGQTLDFAPTADAGNYEITSVRWLKDWGEHGNMLCDEYHEVEPGEPYTVRIWINPKEGYSFADLDDVTVTVNGSTDGVTFTHNDLYTGIICSVAFEKLGYAVSFDANGGTGRMDKVTDVYPDYTLPACGFTAPEGKVFNGWTVDSPSGKWYASGSKLDVNSDVTLYAKWADPTGSHKITFVNRAYDPNPTVEIIVSEGMYTLPGIEGVFEIPSGSTFDDWGINTGGSWQYFDAGREISVTKDLEIIAIWAPIEYESISKAVFEVKLNAGAEYKHGMLAGSLSVSLGEVSGTFNEGAPKPISLASGGYGHGYWIVSGDMLQGTDPLSTRGGYRLYVKFDIPDDRHVLFHPDGFSLSGDLGNITAWNIVSLDGALVAVFKLPAVPGAPLTADAVTFTLAGYEIDQTVTELTVGSSTAHVSLQGSGYGIDNAYMIYEDYVDFDTKVTDPHATFEKHQDYCLVIDYALDEGYSFPDSFWDGSYLKKDKFKLAGFEDAVVTAVTKTSVSFRLPQLGTTAVESLEITLNGYEAGKTAWDVSLTAPECMNLPELDNPTYPPYGRLYCYYDPVYGFGDSADGDCSPIDSGTVLKVGDQYPFTIKFYPVDGYNYTKLEKEDITLVTPYGTCTATRFRPGFSENSYWLTFDLPAIGTIATTPITSVTISDLAKPVVGVMPDNDVTVGGTGVTVDDEGSYWGRFASPQFSPYYSDGTTAVDSAVFRDGETYMFQLYLNAATGYEFTADSKFIFDGKELPALDMADLSKTGAMVNPSDSTQAIVYINMNDIPDGASAPSTYDLWVGGTQVTEDNKGDILGDSNAKYDPATNTLTLTGATLTNVYSDALIYVKDMELIINAPSGLTLDNTANDGPAIYAYGSHDLTVNGNVDLKADAAPAIVCGKNLTINGNAKVNSASSAVLTASGSVTINGNATINSGSSAPGISAGADIVLNGSTHEVNSSLLGSAAVTITGDFKSTVTGNAPAIKGNEVSITGKVDITSDNSLGIAVSNKVSIKGDTKIEAKQMAISVNAGSVVLEGTKHELTSTEAPGIYCSGDITIKGAVIATAGPQAINSTGGTVTIDGDVTATSTAAPAITAKTIEVKSGTWTLSGNPMAMYAESIVIPDTHEIVKPEGAKLNDEKTCIVEADGTTNVSDATIAPKAGAAKTLYSIAITTPPTKTAYTAGETFDPTGMVVTATYSDSSTAPVTGYTVSPSAALSESDTQITVTYTEGGVTKTATQTITVTAASGSGGTGSSGSGGVTTHSITVDSTKNGTITVSPKSAAKGTTVILTVDPDKGYTLETLSVTDASGKEIELTNKGDGKYTFTMPASKVTIKATFMEDNTMLNYFVDVFATDYYYDAVLWAVGEGITNGTSATTFSPGAVCTRAQMATFLWRAAGSPDLVGNSNPFADVSEDTYYAKAVQWAYEQGITGGMSATTYSPDAPCTRAQMVAFLHRVAGTLKPEGSINPFTDVPDTYYTEAVQWAYEQGITSGTSATAFSPDEICTRGQMVTFLYRFFVK